MIIGVPKESKIMEGRVGLIPSVCEALVKQGHEVVIETAAGLQSGYDDDHYRDAGAVIVDSAADVYLQARLIVKVKEPIDKDLPHIRSHHLLFCFLHLAANQPLAEKLCDIGCTAIAFESVNHQGRRIILEPMSQIAGRLSVQIGSHLLHQPMGGMGVLLGGIESTDPGHVVILGAGIAGHHAADVAACIGAKVTVFDIDKSKLAAISLLRGNIETQLSNTVAIEKAVKTADLVVGAVLLPDKHTPRLVTENMVKSMLKGSVVVDIAIDQGGCVETIRPTSYAEPTYRKHDVIHFGVTNMPGAVPRTASQALSMAIQPYVEKLAKFDDIDNSELQAAINVKAGEIVLPALKTEFAD